MVALDLSTAKIQLLESFSTVPTSEDNIAPNEAYHTAKVEILHRPTPMICQGLFTMWRDRFMGGEVEKPGQLKAQMQVRSFVQTCASACLSARRG